MKPLVVDIESNGLLEEGDTIWCIVTKELGRDKWYYWAFDDHDRSNLPLNRTECKNLEEILQLLSSSPFSIFHNGYGFDKPFISKLYPDWEAPYVEDTFILSSLFEPDRPGGHSLEQWGKDLGLWKQEHEDWSQFSTEMLTRCFRDVELTEKIWFYLDKERQNWKENSPDGRGWEQAIKIEYTVAGLCAQMQLNGVLLDIPKAEQLLSRINKELDEIDKKLLELIPKQITNKNENGSKMAEVSKPFKKDGSYTKQVKDWFRE